MSQLASVQNASFNFYENIINNKYEFVNIKLANQITYDNSGTIIMELSILSSLLKILI